MLAELERERQRRLNAGQWSKGSQPRLLAVPRDGEALQAAQQRALYEYLAKCPDAPKTIPGYDWLVVECVDPAPAVELPFEQFDQPIYARDVTPRRRGPMPPAPPPPEPWRGPSRNDRVIEAHAAIKRREQNFHDGDWGNPLDFPLRYPRGPRGV